MAVDGTFPAPPKGLPMPAKRRTVLVPVTLAFLLLALSAATLPPGDADAPPTDAAAREAPESSFHEDGGGLVHMSVRVVGSPRGEWVILATGEAHLPAPAAALTLQSSDGRVAPPADASPGEWRRSLALSPGQRFQESFRLAPTEEGTVVVDFEHDAAPSYFLKSAYAVRVHLGPAGPEVEVEQVTADDSYSPSSTTTTADSGADEGAVTRTSPLVLAGKAYIDGTVLFLDHKGSYKACRYCTVEVRDWDNGGLADDRLATLTTDYDGWFGVELSNANEEDGTKNDVYFRIVTDSKVGSVVDDQGRAYSYDTGIRRQDIWDGTHNLGRVELWTTSWDAGGFFIHRSIATGWNTMKSYVNDDIGPVGVVYPAEYLSYGDHDRDTAHYHAGGQIHLGSDALSADVHAHEQGHYIMYWAYGNDWPSGSACPKPRLLEQETNVHCAWREGWATYMALVTWGNSKYRFNDNSWIDIESRDPYSIDGTDAELRVAGTLWDLTDSVAETYDNVDYQFWTLWSVFRHNGGDDTTLCDYYGNWKAKGYSQTNFVNAAKQNRIYASSANAFTC